MRLQQPFITLDHLSFLFWEFSALHSNKTLFILPVVMELLYFVISLIFSTSCLAIKAFTDTLYDLIL